MRLLHRIGATPAISPTRRRRFRRRGHGDAAAGMCIDFYGRFQSEATAPEGLRARFATRGVPRWTPIPLDFWGAPTASLPSSSEF
jgi:hypothetical protein